MSASKVWTAARISALGVRTDGVTACSIVYNVGRTKAYELLRHPEDLDFRVIKVPGSNRYVVPTSEILRLLFGDTIPAEPSDAPSGNAGRMYLVSDAERRRAG